jgi:chorismate-pyruvate lyase
MLVKYDPDLVHLAGSFHASLADLGEFTLRAPAQLAEPYRKLLAHEHHMTVTVENFHRCLVDVEVLAARTEGDHYLRQIVLHRQTDRAIVMYGLVRLDLTQLSPEVRDEILSRKIPLGRVLIQHNVHRTIHLSQLWKITCGPDLAAVFGIAEGQETYGRTAAILTEGKPTIELLEVVAPA